MIYFVIESLNLNPFATDNTLVCGEYLNLLVASLSMWSRENISSKFSNQSEADALELLENLEEVVTRYILNNKCLMRNKCLNFFIIPVRKH